VPLARPDELVKCEKVTGFSALRTSTRRSAARSTAWVPVARLVGAGFMKDPFPNFSPYETLVSHCRVMFGVVVKYYIEDNSKFLPRKGSNTHVSEQNASI
jgi:hypothetical protein